MDSWDLWISQIPPFNEFFKASKKFLTYNQIKPKSFLYVITTQVNNWIFV